MWETYRSTGLQTLCIPSSCKGPTFKAVCQASPCPVSSHPVFFTHLVLVHTQVGDVLPKSGLQRASFQYCWHRTHSPEQRLSSCLFQPNCCFPRQTPSQKLQNTGTFFWKHGVEIKMTTGHSCSMPCCCALCQVL